MVGRFAKQKVRGEGPSKPLRTFAFLRELGVQNSVSVFIADFSVVPRLAYVLRRPRLRVAGDYFTNTR